MKDLNVLSLLTAALGIADATSETALQIWVDKHMDALIEKARGLLKGGFNVGAVMALAVDVVAAVQDLKGVIAGKDRAAVAQIVLLVAARAALPDLVEAWVIPLLSGEGVKALIEAAFLKVFGPDKVPVPAVPVIVPDDSMLGKVATDADFAPSMAEKYGKPK